MTGIPSYPVTVDARVCPKCSAKLQTKALTDSDQRIWAKWRYCEVAACGWDERQSK